MDSPILGASLSALRETRTSVKWRVFGADVLPVWVAEMDAAPCAPSSPRSPPRCRGDTGYLGAAVRRRRRPVRRGHLGLAGRPGRGRPRHRRDDRRAEMLRLLTDRGAAVVVSSPVYDSFFGFIEAIGRRRRCAAHRRGAASADTLGAAFRAAHEPGGRAAYLLCNPQNPTGAVHTRSELAMVAALAEEHGVRVVADEIHAPARVCRWRGSPRTSPSPGPSEGSASSPPRRDGTSPGSRRLSLSPASGPSTTCVGSTRSTGTGRPTSPSSATSRRSTRGATGWAACSGSSTRTDLVGSLLARSLPEVGTGCRRGPTSRGSTSAASASVTTRRGSCGTGAGSPSPVPRYGTPGRGFARLNLATSPEILPRRWRGWPSVL